jgi:hypothetical protein
MLVWLYALIPVIHRIAHAVCWVGTIRMGTRMMAFLPTGFLVTTSSICFLWHMAEVWVSIPWIVGVLSIVIATLIAVGRLISKRIIWLCRA